jgi:putative transposase
MALATLRTELVHHEHYVTPGRARGLIVGGVIIEYIETFYDRKRLHRSLGYQSPEAFEAGLNYMSGAPTVRGEVH